MDNKRNQNVRRLKQPMRINAGLIVFAFIFVYIFVYVIIYFTKEHVAIYEVVEKSISENNHFTALAIRDEEVVNTSEAGYITFYKNNGSRVAVNDLVFSVDEGGSAFDELTKNIDKTTFLDSDYQKIQDEVNYFKTKKNDASYDNVYSFKNTITAKVLEMNNSAIYSDLEALISSVGEDKLVVSKTPKSGIICTMIDGYEDKTVDSVNESSFVTSDYNVNEHNTGDLLEKNEAAYKLITSDDWNLVIKLDKKQYKSVQDKKSIGITFKKDGFKTTADITTKSIDGKYYGILTLKKYMVNYINERFIDIELAINTAKGLKIPNSAIVEKSFYVIPLNMFVNDAGADRPALCVEAYKDNGDKTSELVDVDIYYKTEEEGYVDALLFDIGTKIVNPVDATEFTITKKDTLTGVYNVNKGYCDFRRINVLYSSNEYSIVEKGSESDYTLAKFDHIILDAKVAVEQELIY